jgi:HlyD family secretion protein
MEVRIYVPLKKLAELKIGQTVSVKVDGLSQTLAGKISWIAAEAEFTPKTILTAETRTTLVYAVKVKIANTQGVLKIGMPVEVGW